jgi:fermentation-respiration switch protein FrsA (DUF1100 family)
MKRDITAIILFTLIAYLLVIVAVHCTQSHAIFRSGGASYDPPASLDVDPIELATPDGERLHAWWMRSPNAEKTVLFFPPNGTNISTHGFRLKTFREMNVNALLVDYRGYGRSTGRIRKEQDIYTDGQTAWNYLTCEKGISPETIIVWGRSLGGGVAVEIARSTNIAALVLESTFFSMDDVARRQYWFLPTKKLLKFHFENGRKLRQITAPVVIIHSVDDDYIPFDQALRLFAAATGPKFFIRTTGSHWDSFDAQGIVFGSQPVPPNRQDATLSALMGHLNLPSKTSRMPIGPGPHLFTPHPNRTRSPGTGIVSIRSLDELFACQHTFTPRSQLTVKRPL